LKSFYFKLFFVYTSGDCRFRLKCVRFVALTAEYHTEGCYLFFICTIPIQIFLFICCLPWFVLNYWRWYYYN